MTHLVQSEQENGGLIKQAAGFVVDGKIERDAQCGLAPCPVRQSAVLTINNSNVISCLPKNPQGDFAFMSLPHHRPIPSKHINVHRA